VSCTQNCNQGRACNCYRANFDALGQPVDQAPPWTAPDLLIVLLAVLCIVGLVSGVFK
jgi:hypothetical protein